MVKVGFSDIQTHQLVKGDLGSFVRNCKPPGSSSYSGSTHVAWGKDTKSDITITQITSPNNGNLTDSSDTMLKKLNLDI